MEGFKILKISSTNTIRFEFDWFLKLICVFVQERDYNKLPPNEKFSQLLNKFSLRCEWCFDQFVLILQY